MQATVRTKDIPFPTKGWNTRDPIESMKPEYAVDLVNVIPRARNGELRPGFRVHATTMGTGAIPTLVEYNAMDGTRQLIAAGTNGKIYNATTFNAAGTQIGTGFTVYRWQHVNFRNKLILCNGTDQPQQWDGTTLSNAVYTGVSNDNLLIAPAVFKSRVWFAEKGTQSVWYGKVQEITGVLTEYPVGELLKNGGYVLWVGSWTRDTGNGLQDMLLICSSTGELLGFQGDYPGSTTDWQLVARFYLPRPLGRRSLVNYGAESAIISEYGILPVSDILRANGDNSIFDEIIPINSAFREAAQIYGTNDGWEAALYPSGDLLIVNIPTQSASMAEQYAMNTVTGAWCRFTGMNATSWAAYNSGVYFGGNDGKIYEFDYGQNDNGSSISALVSTAYNNLGRPTNIKRVTLGRPFITCTDDISFGFGVDMDYNRETITDTASSVGSAGTAWGSPWGSPWSPRQAPRSEWYSVEGVGYSASVQMRGDFKNIGLSISGFLLNYEEGGIF